MCKNNLWNSSARSFCVALTVVSLMFMATAGNAACGSHGGSRPSAAASLATLANLTAAEGEHGNSIVGLWHVTYTMADGTFYYESYDTWHSDRTEWESANLAPIAGNICEGVWRQIGPTVHLNHVGWAFDNSGNAIGPFTQLEDIVVGDNGNSYHGTFDFKQYDMNGNLIQEVTGTIAATRITVI
jgi:hypothetical protein